MAIDSSTTIDEVLDLSPDAWDVLDDWGITITPAVRRSTIREVAAAHKHDLYQLLEDLREAAEGYEDWDED